MQFSAYRGPNSREVEQLESVSHAARAFVRFAVNVYRIARGCAAASDCVCARARDWGRIEDRNVLDNVR